jgi:hypothetical protein
MEEADEVSWTGKWLDSARMLPNAVPVPPILGSCHMFAGG